MVSKYYFYRYVNQDCTEVQFLGAFTTDKAPEKIWDILFQVFSGDNGNSQGDEAAAEMAYTRFQGQARTRETNNGQRNACFLRPSL